MNDSKDYLASTEAPYTVILGDKTYTFPKLKLKNISVLASKCKALQVKNLKELIEDEKPEARARFLALTVARDYNINDVWDWIITIDGGTEALVTSLVQGGMTKEEATSLVEELDASTVLDIATEITGHYNSPTKVAKRVLEEEKKKKDAKGEEEKK